MYDDDIAILVDMGFAPEKAAQALQFTHVNREQAIDILLIPIRSPPARKCGGPEKEEGQKRGRQRRHVVHTCSTLINHSLLSACQRTGDGTRHGDAWSLPRHPGATCYHCG